VQATKQEEDCRGKRWVRGLAADTIGAPNMDGDLIHQFELNRAVGGDKGISDGR